MALSARGRACTVCLTISKAILTPPSRPTRQRILLEALRLFGERGYEATSIAEIEGAAGLSPGSGALYRHFPSKLAVLGAALDERMREIEAFQDRIRLAPLGDLRSELTLAARWGLAELERERSLARIVMAEGHRVPEVAERFRHAIVVRGLDLAEGIVERHASARGTSVEDPRAVAEVLCASLVGWSLQELLFGERFAEVDVERFVAAWVDSAAAVVESLERSS